MKRLALLVATLLLAACGQSPAQPSPSTSAAASASEGPIIVFAAASLNKAFPAASAGLNAQYSFDGSSGLVDQLKGGAPADVFASADKKNMDKAVEAGLIDGTPAMFATNYLVLVTPADNPGGITGFDASLDGKKLVVCAPEVPCGAATARSAEGAGMTLKPVSEENNVTDVLGKVTGGEADAGLVYATDAAGAGDKVKVLDVPGAKNDPNTYWIGVVKGAPNKAGADAFVARILGEGQTTLATFGFGPPQ
ncbi:MAG: molybdate ABC transporter substrate-binding protein [Propioniciclava sp.]|uniref:molybdate ABC transporter substrate-binding protein n=1 Tax=Propioniciclava sp. TaxID=2038686 RepID=UPI0039E6AADA